MPDEQPVYFIHEKDMTPYSPLNHTGTSNRRLISPETVGSTQLEVVIGTVQPDCGALPHRHPGIEQVCYLLKGKVRVEVGGQTAQLGVGDCCFFPSGECHNLTAIGDEEARVLVIYAPPYSETGAVAD